MKEDKKQSEFNPWSNAPTWPRRQAGILSSRLSFLIRRLAEKYPYKNMDSSPDKSGSEWYELPQYNLEWKSITSIFPGNSCGLFWW